MPHPFTIIERRGCDLSPVDASTAAGQLLLTSFVWPWQIHRHERLAGALELARRHPVTVDAAGAGDWLPGQLRDDDGPLTVVWQSITQLYWPPAEIERVEEILAAYGVDHRLARVTMEYPAESRPGRQAGALDHPVAAGSGAAARTRLGTAHDHGLPVLIG